MKCMLCTHACCMYVCVCISQEGEQIEDYIFHPSHLIYILQLNYKTGLMS